MFAPTTFTDPFQNNSCGLCSSAQAGSSVRGEVEQGDSIRHALPLADCTIKRMTVTPARPGTASFKRADFATQRFTFSGDSTRNTPIYSGPLVVQETSHFGQRT